MMLVAAAAGGGCRRDIEVQPENQIDLPPLTEREPDLDPPTTVFPEKWRQADPAVNEYIQQTLELFASGDYDGFRARFGSRFEPPDEESFRHIWENVAEVAVAGLYADRRPDKPLRYYAHFVVQLRKEDAKGRTHRDLVVVMFREANEWRIGQASREDVARVWRASTQPAETAPGSPEAR